MIKIAPWVKTVLIVAGVAFLIISAILLYLLIIGSDESRKREQWKREQLKQDE